MTFSGAVPVIETERLTMRGFRHTDIDDYAAFFADDALTRFIGGALSREDAWRNMAMRSGSWLLRGFGYWALESKNDRRMVGFCGLTFPEGWPEPEIGWAIFSGAQGNGYATEAAKRARAYAYDELGWSTAISLINPLNAPSLRVAQRLGAKQDGAFALKGTELGVFRHPSPTFLKSQSTTH
ncbi:MAG: GNAT family N-acetyltransferase [Rhizobiales bacterium]|nr:GNAT family N-acetyltransferase [Hyphomicrobiales bacterium]